LIGQADNLITRARQGLLTKKEVVDTLSTLRMDFAQQLPRGSSSVPEDSRKGTTAIPAAVKNTEGT
jgi:hypothetical protein